ncbi:MAG: TetR/AcrR family transcriptional regulator [Candidatus Puniceispirillaceae bacterium]
MEKRLQILDAAARVFYERGVRKASFGDIAKAAGISRPTLYAAFEDKNAIMLAAIYHVSEKLLQTIKDQLANKLTAQERLWLFTTVCIIEPYRFIQQSEDAADILSGHNKAGKKAIRHTLEQRAVFLKDILMPFAGETVSGTALMEYTRTFVLSSSGLKNTAADEDELRQNLEILEAWLLRCL